jgi:hypothetical protein
LDPNEAKSQNGGGCRGVPNIAFYARNSNLEHNVVMMMMMMNWMEYTRHVGVCAQAQKNKIHDFFIIIIIQRDDDDDLEAHLVNDEVVLQTG